MKSTRKQNYWSAALVAGLLLIAAFFYLTWEESEPQESTDPSPPVSQVLTIEGRRYDLEEPVYLIGDEIMVPMRELFETAGAEVAFHPHRELAVATFDGTEASVRIDQRHALINKSPYRMDRSSMVIAGSMYVPLDFAQELLSRDRAGAEDDTVGSMEKAIADLN